MSKNNRLLPKSSGRNSSGHITARHIGGRSKRFYRAIDFKREKIDVPGRISAIEYDPNRNANIAQVYYADGSKRYILQPEGLKIGSEVRSLKSGDIKVGNALPLLAIPVGTAIHNVEIAPGRGGIIARGAGTAATLLAKGDNYATIKLPSGETRLVPKDCLATVGTVGNINWKNRVLGKAGRARLMGNRPKVRGTAQNPRTHPHGGGEGRSGVGLKQPKTPWGKPARGLRTRKRNKYSNRFILERRKH